MFQDAVGPWATILDYEYSTTTLPMAAEDHAYSMLPPPPPRPTPWKKDAATQTETTGAHIILVEPPASPTEIDLGENLLDTLINLNNCNPRNLINIDTLEFPDMEEDNDDDDLPPAFPDLEVPLEDEVFKKE